MSHPEFLGLGLYKVFIKKAVEKYFSTAFLMLYMLDFISLRRNHCVSTDGIQILKIITHALNHQSLNIFFPVTSTARN
jgi:hypothetical protein